MNKTCCNGRPDNFRPFHDMPNLVTPCPECNPVGYKQAVAPYVTVKGRQRRKAKEQIFVRKFKKFLAEGS